MDDEHPATRRVHRDVGFDLVGTLSELAAPDLNSTLIAVADRRAADRSGAAIARQYREDRFVAPAAIGETMLRHTEDIALSAAGRFDAVRLAPLVPLGTHSVLGGISQRRVVGTHRGTEVAADPTAGLALEAAERRRRDRTTRCDLSAVQRVTRAQLVDGPVSFAHFSLLGLVSADRDQGSFDTEVALMIHHIDAHLAIIDRLGLEPARVRISDFGAGDRVNRVADGVSQPELVTAWRERSGGQGYYGNLCFKIDIAGSDGLLEVADGGITDWTSTLLEDRKERLMISGAGIDRLASLA